MTDDLPSGTGGLTSANCRRLAVLPGGELDLKLFFRATQVSRVSSLLVARLVA
jgi:hypothetical protein